MLAVVFAAAEEEAERQSTRQEFLAERENFLGAVARKSAIAPFLAEIPEIRREMHEVATFRESLSMIEPEGFAIDMSAAQEMAEQARHKVLPAIYRIIEHLERLCREHDAASRRDLAEKAAMVDDMLVDMGRIGRMIGLISINASVEAARAGGDSGRAFQVIAEEVRDLAKQSSAIVARTKTRLAEDTQRLR